MPQWRGDGEAVGVDGDRERCAGGEREAVVDDCGRQR